MTDETEPQAFPLQWPIGRPRAKYRTASAFRSGGKRLSIEHGVRRVVAELGRFRARAVTISSNVKPTLGGSLTRETPSNGDPGVAVYFRLNDQPHCVSCDRWDRVADNLAAVAAHIEATRGILRWGTADVAQLFAGFKALPPMEAGRTWWAILGFKEPPASPGEIADRKLALLLAAHPDKNPGDNAAANRAAEITAAAAEGCRLLEMEARP